MDSDERARRNEVREAVAKMGEDFRHCRDYGHVWRPVTAYQLAKGKGWEETIKCQGCQASRLRQLDRDGGVLVNRYRYEEGYLVAGLGRLTGADRGVLRIASIMDHLTGDA